MASLLPETCLICSKNLEDQKPIVTGEKSEKWTEFKEAFLCFCKLLNISGKNVEDKVLDKAFVALGGGGKLEWSVDGVFGLPCCGECCGALRDVVRLQREIDMLKRNQMDYVEGLKLSLLSVNVELIKDVWSQIRKQLIACLLKRPNILQSQPIPLSKTRPVLTRKIPNILRRKSRRNHSDAEEEMFDDVSFDDMPTLSPSPPSNLEHPPMGSRGTRKRKRAIDDNETSGTEEVVETEDPLKVVRPCSVVLERLATPTTPINMKQDDNDCYNNSGPVIASATSSGPNKKYNYGNLFYLINNNTLLCKYTLLKVTRGGTQLACMERGCSTILRDPDWQALFEKMKKHVENNHLDDKLKIPRTCPLCQVEFMQGKKFRSHLLSAHSLETVVCEQCWKPIRHVADSYRYHKWFHKNKQEQAEAEEGPPKQVLYKQRKSVERKLQKQLRRSGRTGTDLTPQVPCLSPRVNKMNTRRKAKVTHVRSRKIPLISASADYKSSENLEETQETNLCEEDVIGDSEDNFVPSAGECEDDDDDYVPEKRPTRKRTTKVPKVKPTKSTTATIFRGTKTKPPKSHTGRYVNPRFWVVDENLLLYKSTPIQVSHGRTQFKCLENDCDVIIQTPCLNDHLDLFEQIKSHVESSHNPVREEAGPENSSIRVCPISTCLAECQGAKNFRVHLFSAHGLERVICEICWKPIRHIADSYRLHKWNHNSELEKCQYPPPRQVVYKALKSKKSKTKTRELLEKIGVKLKEGGMSAKKKTFSTPTNHTTENEYFSQLQDNLLLYKYTILKIKYGQGISCGEPGCSTVVAKGTDYTCLELAKSHVKECHMSTPTDDDAYRHKSRQCPLCEEECLFNDGGSFRRHLLGDKHGPCSYICQSCWKPIKLKDTVARHMKCHEPSIVKEESPPLPVPKQGKKTCKVSCPDCGREFNSLTNLRHHAPTHLPKALRPQWNCTDCPDTFLSRVALRNHIERIHRRNLQRHRYCPICNQRFYHRDGTIFKVHLRSHTNERPFVCDLCGKAFTSQSQFKNHQTRVHVQERIHQCEYCEMNYKHPSNLKRHQEAVHRDKVLVADPDEKMRFTHLQFRPDFIGPKIAFPCEFCGKVFQLKSRMTKHVRLCHSGVHENNDRE